MFNFIKSVIADQNTKGLRIMMTIKMTVTTMMTLNADNDDGDDDDDDVQLCQISGWLTPGQRG